MSHVAGSLEPGKYADLVVMDVPDYRELARRVGDSDAALVMRAGQPVSGGRHWTLPIKTGLNRATPATAPRPL